MESCVIMRCPINEPATQFPWPENQKASVPASEIVVLSSANLSRGRLTVDPTVTL